MPGELDDICFNKASIIRRCLVRIREEYEADPGLANITRVDALTLNIERACQAAIDLAFHIVARDKLGMPQTSGDAFSLLRKASVISEKTARSMVSMTGFRNVAVHEYQAMDMSILRAVAETHWETFVLFCEELGLRI